MDETQRNETETALAKTRRYVRIALRYAFSHVGLCSLVIGYALLGALTFESLESRHELKERDVIRREREECLSDLWNITRRMNVLYQVNWTKLARKRLRNFERDVVDAVKNNGYDGKDAGDRDLQWSFSGALLYCITVITTIGYGNIAPKTSGGRLLTIFYALLGIPLMLLCLTNIGDVLARTFKVAYFFARKLYESSRNNATNEETPPAPAEGTTLSENETSESRKNSAVESFQLSSPEDAANETTLENNRSPEIDALVAKEGRVPIYIVLMFVTCYICIGATIFYFWESWDFLDSAYFCFITLSTIGFGDLVPGTSILNPNAEEGQSKLIICCFYLIVGLAIIAMSFSLVQEEVTIRCKNIGERLGIVNKSDK